MKCEKCKAEFTIKGQAKTKGCCPSCGEMLTASAYCDDAKAWLWYQYRSPIPLSVILAYVYLFGGGGLAGLIVLESAGLGLWTVTDPSGWLSVITAALIFMLPFFALFFMPSARRWRAKCREDNLVYEAAVKRGKLSLRKFQMVVAIIYLAATLGTLCCLHWATPTAHYGRGVAVKAST